jgi:hypothetical protein
VISIKLRSLAQAAIIWICRRTGDIVRIGAHRRDEPPSALRGALIADMIGESKYPILIAGASHACCMGVPLTVESGIGPLLRIDEHFDALVGTFPRDDAYWESTVQQAHGRDIVIVWRGNQHYGRFLLRETPPFDLVVPSHPQLPLEAGAVLVPFAAVKEFWRVTFIGLEDMLQRLAALGTCRAFVLGTPPPIRETTVIQAELEKHSHYFDIELKTAQLTPRRVFWKLWASIQLSMEEVAQKYNARFIPVPEHFKTEDEFLKSVYAQAIDYTHANSLYGTEMRHHLLKEIREGQLNASV